jgi:murein DD-endopeptidase MepM/ murein hydrolase activator NlpD
LRVTIDCVEEISAAREARDLPHKGLTIIVVPQTHRRTMSLRFSVPILRLTGVTALLLAVVGTTYLHNVNQHIQHAEAIARERDALRAITADQQQEIATWQTDFTRLASAVQQVEVEQKALQELETKVRHLLGGSGGPVTGTNLPPPYSPGDFGSPTETLSRTEALTVEQKQRAASLAAVASDLDRHIAYLASRPSGWPAAGSRSDGYGWRLDPFGGGRAFHGGLDIAGALGSEISARADGTVVFSDWMAGGYGLTVVIDHGNEFQTLYAHNSANLVHEGESVKRGDVIAKMGSTGYSTGPHVHYEVHVGGAPVDPTPYLD